MKRRMLNILIGLDQFLQVIVYLGNYTPDETISGIIGRKVKTGTANKLEVLICKCLRKLESNHCIKSIDSQETLEKDS
jgi:hypothetical protein